MIVVPNGKGKCRISLTEMYNHEEVRLLFRYRFVSGIAIGAGVGMAAAAAVGGASSASESQTTQVVSTHFSMFCSPPRLYPRRGKARARPQPTNRPCRQLLEQLKERLHFVARRKRM